MNNITQHLLEMNADKVFALVSELREINPESAGKYLMHFYEIDVQIKKKSC